MNNTKDVFTNTIDKQLSNRQHFNQSLRICCVIIPTSFYLLSKIS